METNMKTQTIRLHAWRISLLGCCFAPAAAIAIEVSITKFYSIPTNTAATIGILISPGENTNAVTLEIKKLTGSGSAEFVSTMGTSLIATTSTNLGIRGLTISSAWSNMLLEARSGSQLLDSNVFSVVGATMISSTQAIAAASDAIAGTVELQPGAPITAVLSGEVYVVTFGYLLPADTLGPDYAAVVAVDAFSGTVINILSGS